MGIDTHALSEPVFDSVMEVLTANEVNVIVGFKDKAHVYSIVDEAQRIVNKALAVSLGIIERHLSACKL
jgi:phosphoglucomutase